MNDLMSSVPPQSPVAERRPVRPFGGTVAQSLAVAVAPSTGRFHPELTDGYAGEGALIGHVTGGRGRSDEVRMPADGHVQALLVRPGQLVRAGQGLAWVERTDELVR